MGLKLGSKSMFGRCGVVYEKTNDGTNTFGRRRDKGDCGMYHHATADMAASNTCTTTSHKYTSKYKNSTKNTEANTQIHKHE